MPKPGDARLPHDRGGAYAHRFKSLRPTHSTTPLPCCKPLAARPTPSSILPPSPVAWASTLTWSASTPAPSAHPSWLDLKPTGKGYMEDFTRRVARAADERTQAAAQTQCAHRDRANMGRDSRRALHLPSLAGCDSHPRSAAAGRRQPDRGQGIACSRRRGVQVRRGESALLNKTGRAVVFTSLDDLAARVDSPDLDVTPDDFLVLQNAGPIGAPGMPEAGYLPIPQKLPPRG